MNDKRRKKQLQLAFMTKGRAESPRLVIGGVESFTAESKAENPATAKCWLLT
jgi:hypothetical protein